MRGPSWRASDGQAPSTCRGIVEGTAGLPGGLSRARRPTPALAGAKEPVESLGPVRMSRRVAAGGRRGRTAVDRRRRWPFGLVQVSDRIRAIGISPPVLVPMAARADIGTVLTVGLGRLETCVRDLLIRYRPGPTVLSSPDDRSRRWESRGLPSAIGRTANSAPSPTRQGLCEAGGLSRRLIEQQLVD